jgi:hypothetical protein
VGGVTADTDAVLDSRDLERTNVRAELHGCGEAMTRRESSAHAEHVA